MERIMPNRLDRGFYQYQEEFESKAIEVLRSGWYVLGNEVKNFEDEFSDYVGAKHCVGLASGLDALWIAFRILGIGKGGNTAKSNGLLLRILTAMIFRKSRKNDQRSGSAAERNSKE